MLQSSGVSDLNTHWRIDMSTVARHRERGFGSINGTINNQYLVGSGPLTSGEYLQRYEAEVMDDYVTDHYHRRILAGEIINNPCVYTHQTIEEDSSEETSYNPAGTGTTLTIRQTGPITKYRMYGTGTGYLAATPVLNTSMAEAKLAALASIDSSAHAFAEDAGELQETIRFLKNPIGSLKDLTVSLRNELRRTNRTTYVKARSAATLAKEVSSLWLEYRFAASPLVRSVNDALEAYSEIQVFPPERLTSRGKSTGESIVMDSVVTLSGHTFSRVTTSELEQKAAILYTVTNPIRDWRYRYGFRSKDFPTTTWQLVPLSFMVDRMYDVTSFLKGAINLGDPKVKILSGSQTTKVRTTESVKYQGYNGSPDWSAIGDGNERTRDTFSYNRVPWSPSFSDTIPRFKPEGLVSDITNVADLTALIISFVSPFATKTIRSHLK